MITVIGNEQSEFTILHISFDTEAVDPTDLRDLQLPFIKASKGVVISGRGPIWMHSAIAHRVHFAKWVAIYDPRLDGAVVVINHSPKQFTGQVISLVM